MSSETVRLEEPQFSKLRAALWPIHGSEMKKFLPLSLMMFFILFVYTIVRVCKDTLVVKGAGAEAISFVKFWGVLPAAVIFVIFFTKLANKLSREKLFYLIIGSFILFFICFAFLIQPNSEFLHPSEATVKSLQESIPPLRHFFALWGAWSASIFFIGAELWGAVCLTLLFWQFANEITRTHEAKRFYSLLPLLANVALIAAGAMIDYFANLGKASPHAWTTSLQYLMSFVAVAGICTMGIYWWMGRKVLTDPKQYDGAQASNKSKKSKPKLSVKESFKYIASSRYLGCIALLVLCYGISINLVEVLWKSQVDLQFPDANDFTAYMGKVQQIIGISTIVLIVAAKGIVRRFGWLVGAVLTPIVLGVTGTLFFAFVIFRGELGWMSAAFGVTPVFMAVICGTIQNFLSKSTKYSLFDPTKEMAYIPLDQELKVKGKAAVDVVGGRLGKSGGSMIQQLLLVIGGASATQISIAPYLGGVLVIVTLIWIFAAKGLSKRYHAELQKEKAIEPLKVLPGGAERSEPEPLKIAA